MWAKKEGIEMSINGKELDEVYQKQYSGGVEEGRLSCSKANEAEYILTMHYIHKYLDKPAKIIDIGAGCGVYTGPLAQEGHVIDALDLHEDRVTAIKEAVRVAKKGAPVFVAFVLQDAPLIEYIFQSENPAEEIKEIGYERDTARVTENTGSSIYLEIIPTIDELTDKVCEDRNIKKGPRFAQDGLSQVIRDSVNNMSEASYKEWIQYLIATAERADLMGFSNHVVQIFIKD